MGISDRIRRFFRRSPWKVASDLLFVVLFLMLIIPSTRSVIFSGVAKVRAIIMPVRLNEKSMESLQAESWNWILEDLQGQRITLSDLKGKVIFINQWATWCPPCRAEMPSIQKLYNKVGGDISMLVVTQEEADVVKEFIDKHSYTFPVYIVRSAIPNDFISRGIPVTHLITPSGKLAVKKMGAYNWNSPGVRKMIKQLLKEGDG